jgi:cobalt/nickel transport system permease protein
MSDRASPRVRILSGLALAFAVAATESPKLLPVLLLIAILALWHARAPWQRIRAPLGLALAFMLGLGLASGETVLLHLGPLVLYSDGLLHGAMIAARMLAIIALVFALLGRLSPQALAAGLRGLRLPALMADMTMLTLRYLDEARAELSRAELARRLRAGPGGWRAMPDRAMILAASLIRAQDRAERIWAAMRLRGHGATVKASAPSRAEIAFVALAVALGTVLVMLDRTL